MLRCKAHRNCSNSTVLCLKAILTTLKADIIEATGSLQLAAILECGSEAAIHTMYDVYHLQEIDGVILVDASKIFNSLNRQEALRYIQHRCPSIATFLINTHHTDIDLFIDRETIHSQKGTAQSECYYHCPTNTPCSHWWQTTGSENLVGQYYTFESKLWPLFKCFEGIASCQTASTVKSQKRFEGIGVSVTADGRHYLDAALCTDPFMKNYVREKVVALIEEVEFLSKTNSRQPYTAYVAYVHGLQSINGFLFAN